MTGPASASCLEAACRPRADASARSPPRVVGADTESNAPDRGRLAAVQPRRWCCRGWQSAVTEVRRGRTAPPVAESASTPPTAPGSPGSASA